MGAHGVKNSVHMEPPPQSEVLEADSVYFPPQKCDGKIAKDVAVAVRMFLNTHRA